MIEFEVKILNIDIKDAQSRLLKNGAVLQKPAVVHKNIVFHLPQGREIENGWLRTRDEGDKITMSLKIMGREIADQQEICFIADSMDEAVHFLELMGAREKAHQEKRRETWLLEDCEVVIDEWPFLDPIIEIEGPSEESVKKAVEKLGYAQTDCRVCAADTLYKEKYGVEEDIVNNHTPRLVFEMDNPFIG